MSSDTYEIRGGIAQLGEEKHDLYEKHEVRDEIDSLESEPDFDFFVPFPVAEGAPEETHSQILTIRAVVVGCILGGLVNASNVYLGE